MTPGVSGDRSRKAMGYGLGDFAKTVVTGGLSDVYNIVKPKPVSATPATDAQQKSYDLANSLAAERQGIDAAAGGGGTADAAQTFDNPHGGVSKAPTTGTVDTYGPPQSAPNYARPAAPMVDRGQSDEIRNQQQANIGMLTRAAYGKVPSAAELQGKAAADRAAAQQYGLAVALQGRNAGAALRQASEGAATVQGNAATQAMQLRAQEQANARAQLTQALGGTRGQDIQTAMADQSAKLTAMGYDEATKRALLAAQLQAMGYGVQEANAILGVGQANTNATNQFNGQLLGTAGQLAMLGMGGPPGVGAGGGGAGGGYTPPQYGDDIYRPA